MNASEAWRKVYEIAEARYIQANEMVINGYEAIKKNLGEELPEQEAELGSMDVERLQKKRDAVFAFAIEQDTVDAARSELLNALDFMKTKEMKKATGTTGSGSDAAMQPKMTTTATS